MAELIRFRCLACGKRLRAWPQHAGRKGHCSCGCPMCVPALPPRQREAETSAAGIRRQLWPWLAAEAAILALATVLAFWLAGSVNRSPDPSQPPRPPLAAALLPLVESPRTAVGPPDQPLPEKQKAKEAALPQPDPALPEPAQTPLGLRLSPSPESVAREEAMKKEWGLLQGRWRAVRVQARLGGLEQSGIGHFIPALRVLDSEFHWAGNYAQNLVDADLAREVASIDPRKDRGLLDRKLKEGLTRMGLAFQAEQKKMDREAVERALEKAGRIAARGEKAEATIDPTQEPKAIDFRIQDGPLRGKTQRGIYRIRGDTLEFCVNGAEAAQRPTRFTALASDDRGGAVLFTYERTAEAWTDLLRLPNARSVGTQDGGSDSQFWK